MRLLEPLPLRDREARNRVLFGPHETNLGWDRSLSERHLAYYERRAAGGAGIIVTEEASVHESDWPYERCPLATECGPGWSAIARMARRHGALALAAIGHTGGQGSSAYSQRALWAPSGVPEVNTREMPKVMETEDIDAVVRGFGEAAETARRAGLDGVEVNAGQNSLVRQFLSGLTNQRPDGYGSDRLRFAREVLHAVRAGAGGGIVGLRLSCDELAPWAGIVPDAAAEIADQLAPWVDYLVVVRGAIFSVQATRPDGHDAPGFNLDLTRQVRAAVAGRIPVFAQGSIVEVGQAEWALGDGCCDGVEMTRAQIADPDLVAKLAAGHPERIRPCILCNQTCKVRDARNPIVTCVVEPGAGYETTEPDPTGTAGHPVDVTVVGAGVAGLECARVAAGRGHRVTVVDRADEPGGMVRVAAQGAGRHQLAAIADWLTAECERLGVDLRPRARDHARRPDGGRARGAGHREPAGRPHLRHRRRGRGGGGRRDPRGGPLGPGAGRAARPDRSSSGTPSVARSPSRWPSCSPPTGWSVTLVTPDLIVGTLLSRSGDLAPANTRLAAAGVTFVKRAVVREAVPGGVVVEDRFTGDRQELKAAVLVDAGPRLPDDRLGDATGHRHARAGDAVAPRTIYEAVLEGRRAALALESDR